MGRQAKLKKLRKIFKCEDQSLLQELGQYLHMAEKDLISVGVSPTTENLKAVMENLSLIERPKNITDSEFEAFLEEKMLDFIKNNLK